MKRNVCKESPWHLLTHPHFHIFLKEGPHLRGETDANARSFLGARPPHFHHAPQVQHPHLHHRRSDRWPRWCESSSITSSGCCARSISSTTQKIQHIDPPPSPDGTHSPTPPTTPRTTASLDPCGTWRTASRFFRQNQRSEGSMRTYYLRSCTIWACLEWVEAARESSPMWKGRLPSPHSVADALVSS